MFSIAQQLPVAPSVQVQTKKERVYHPRTYSDFVKGLKNNELPQVVIKPTMETHELFRLNSFGKHSLRVMRMLWLT
jgi:cell division protease FtsH